MKRLAQLSILLFISAILCFAIATPAIAAPANPDSITLHTIRVFQNIFEDDDVLFMASYDVEYATEPDEPAKDTFSLAVYDTDGTTLIKSRPLNDYQYNVHSVYFSATQATSLTWGNGYKVRVMGSPSYFPMTEDTTMDTTSLSSFHWIEGIMDTSRDYLCNHCLDLAATLEDQWAITLITTTPERQVLNSTGRIVFLAAVPGLDWAVPDLFQVATRTIPVTKQESTRAFAEELSVGSQLGSRIKEAFEGAGSYIGVSGNMVALMWIGLFATTVASIIFLSSGNTTAALVLTIPIALIGVWAGAIPMAALFAVGAVVVVYMGYHVFLRGM